jgi:hypothetical protein
MIDTDNILRIYELEKVSVGYLDFNRSKKKLQDEIHSIKLRYRDDYIRLVNQVKTETPLVHNIDIERHLNKRSGYADFRGTFFSIMNAELDSPQHSLKVLEKLKFETKPLEMEFVEKHGFVISKERIGGSQSVYDIVKKTVELLDKVEILSSVEDFISRKEKEMNEEIEDRIKIHLDYLVNSNKKKLFFKKKEITFEMAKAELNRDIDHEVFKRILKRRLNEDTYSMRALLKILKEGDEMHHSKMKLLPEINYDIVNN